MYNGCGIWYTVNKILHDCVFTHFDHKNYILVVTCMSYQAWQVQMNSLGSIHTDTQEEYHSRNIQRTHLRESNNFWSFRSGSKESYNFGLIHHNSVV